MASARVFESSTSPFNQTWRWDCSRGSALSKLATTELEASFRYDATRFVPRNPEPPVTRTRLSGRGVMGERKWRRTVAFYPCREFGFLPPRKRSKNHETATPPSPPYSPLVRY